MPGTDVRGQGEVGKERERAVVHTPVSFRTVRSDPQRGAGRIGGNAVERKIKKVAGKVVTRRAIEGERTEARGGGLFPTR